MVWYYLIDEEESKREILVCLLTCEQSNETLGVYEYNMPSFLWSILNEIGNILKGAKHIF